MSLGLGYYWDVVSRLIMTNTTYKLPLGSFFSTSNEASFFFFYPQNKTLLMQASSKPTETQLPFGCSEEKNKTHSIVENVLINGSCIGSVIHPGLFEIIFTSLTLPVAQRQSRLPIPLVTFKESTGWGSQIHMMLERSELSERNTEPSTFRSVVTVGSPFVRKSSKSLSA